MFEPFIEFFEPFIEFVTAEHFFYRGYIGVPARSLAEGMGQWLYLVVALFILSALVIKGKEVVSDIWDKWGF